MLTDSEREALYCVGCGRFVAWSEPGKILAIACSCGAMAPILVPEGADVLDLGWFTPFSLLKASHFGGPIPHLEYYLGFSDHESALKTEVTRMLRALGSISYAECPDEKCRESFEWGKRSYQEWKQRHGV